MWLKRGPILRCLTRGLHVIAQDGDDDDYAEEEEEEGEDAAGPVSRTDCATRVQP